MVTRSIYPKIIKALESDHILLLIGARQVGKTTLLREVNRHLETSHQLSFIFSLEDPSLLDDLNRHPENIFNYLPRHEKKIFLLLDEIQYLDNPTNFLKYMYDLYKGKVQCVVTGSSAFYIDHKFKDSLVGRKKIFELQPFSFSEFLLAKNKLSLAQKITQHNFFDTFDKISLLKPERQTLLQYWNEYTLYGGYPQITLENDVKEKQILLQDLHQSFLKKDIYESRIGDEIKFYNLTKILAGQIGNLVNAQELANTLDISGDTVTKYLYVLQKSYIIKLCRPFFRNIRKELTKMPKVYFLDVGYRNSLLNIYTSFSERPGTGALLENIFLSELAKGGIYDINYWRTQNKNEIDFIVNEHYAFEIKTNAKLFSKAKYKNFITHYPDIKLRLVTASHDQELDLLDFSS